MVTHRQILASRHSFPAFLLFVALLYVLPVQAVLRLAFAPLTWSVPALDLSGVPNPLTLQVNPAYAIALTVCFLIVYLFVAAAMRLVRAYRWDAATAWLDTVTSLKGLRAMDGPLALVLPLITLGFAAITPFWHTENVAVLGLLGWFSLAANRSGRPAEIAPAPLPVPVVPLPQKDVADGNVLKQFVWHFPNRAGSRPGISESPFAVELRISDARYAEYRNRPRELDERKWDIYVIASIAESEVLAGRLLDLGRERGFRPYDQVSNTLAFTQQCIRYAHDQAPDTGELIEYPKYPIETLMEEAGDCEDQAILTAALLKRMGYDVALLFCPGHAALGVAGAQGLPGTYFTDPSTGIQYFYAETTGDGWILGELPKDLEQFLSTGKFDIVPVVMRVTGAQ
ncbi:MAG: hypothetical protein HY675_13245 [Chloroflexi bacterium]|nr:hypothetical protein [Chloroflexota bacterium]